MFGYSVFFGFFTRPQPGTPIRNRDRFTYVPRSALDILARNRKQRAI